MPKSEIDYSNTIIYKITCKDTNIKDIYIGHTTNFVQRKHSHKQSCINDKSFNYKCKLYEVIRNNGGWQNWKMEIINFFNCQDHYEARKKEQEYFISMNATLNSIEPMPTKKPKEIIIKNTIIKETFFCEKCNIKFNNLNLFETHKKTKKHIKNNTREGSIIENSAIFVCKVCHFECSKQSNYNKHILSQKHISYTNGIQKNANKPVCECGKKYNYYSGLWRHKKLCNITENIVIEDASANEIKVLTTIVSELVKSNNDLQQKINEICEKIQHY
jgi:hypothetical protein